MRKVGSADSYISSFLTIPRLPIFEEADRKKRRAGSRPDPCVPWPCPGPGKAGTVVRGYKVLPSFVPQLPHHPCLTVNERDKNKEQETWR